MASVPLMPNVRIRQFFGVRQAFFLPFAHVRRRAGHTAEKRPAARPCHACVGTAPCLCRGRLGLRRAPVPALAVCVANVERGGSIPFVLRNIAGGERGLPGESLQLPQQASRREGARDGVLHAMWARGC